MGEEGTGGVTVQMIAGSADMLKIGYTEQHSHLHIGIWPLFYPKRVRPRAFIHARKKKKSMPSKLYLDTETQDSGTRSVDV